MPKKVQLKSLDFIENNTLYYGCSFYLEENSKKQNCASTNEIEHSCNTVQKKYFSSKKTLAVYFENC